MLDDYREALLLKLRRCGNLAEACRVVGASRSSVYYFRRKRPAFKVELEEARKAYAQDLVESVKVRR